MEAAGRKKRGDGEASSLFSFSLSCGPKEPGGWGVGLQKKLCPLVSHLAELPGVTRALPENVHVQVCTCEPKDH